MAQVITETAPHVDVEVRPRDPVYQAYQILHVGFVVLPVLAGLDKFLYLLGDWTAYLAPGIPEAVGLSAVTFMALVGIVEVFAGILVAVIPRIGGYVVAIWLAAIIANLIIVGGFLDIALRDFGLLLGAVAMARLAHTFHRARRAPGTVA